VKLICHNFLCTSPRVSKGDTSKLHVSPLLTRRLVQSIFYDDLRLSCLDGTVYGRAV
jgi:hypothetical protein